MVAYGIVATFHTANFGRV
ncbi:hypothetical protein [Pedobacter suwonensis]